MGPPLPEIKLVPLRLLFALEVQLITVSSTEVSAGFLWCFSNAINSFLPAASVSCLKVWVYVQHEATPGCFSVCLPLNLTLLPLDILPLLGY